MEATRRVLTAVGSALLGVALCTSCARKVVPPAPSPGVVSKPVQELERQVAIQDLAFTEEVLQKIETAAGAPLERLTNWEDELTGVEAAVNKGTVEELVASLGAELQPSGYLVFQSDHGFDRAPDRIGVVKGTDQYDILRAVQTDGANYDIMNEDVTAKLKEWEARYPFRITGAGGDWVEARFDTVPPDMDAFAAEVYEFCPDVVAQGSGDVASLAREMRQTRTLCLWWD